MDGGFPARAPPSIVPTVQSQGVGVGHPQELPSWHSTMFSRLELVGSEEVPLLRGLVLGLLLSHGSSRLAEQ